jgi:sugar (pentulose or hexulose) kinase
MKPGELRRFKDGLMGTGRVGRVSGQPFVVINVHPHLHPHVLDAATDFLVGGQIETGWSLMWVMNNSEVLNEAG